MLGSLLRTYQDLVPVNLSTFNLSFNSFKIIYQYIGKKSRCQPDELNNRNKWRKYTRCYALTKFLSIVEFAPRCSRQNNKEQNVPYKEQKKTEGTERKRTRCPTLVTGQIMLIHNLNKEQKKLVRNKVTTSIMIILGTEHF